jgi:hypothetical protein
MYQVLDLKKLVGLFAVIAAIVVFIGVYVAPPKTLQGYIHRASGAASATGIILLLAGESPLFHAIWKYNVVQKLFFPYIHGRWEGEISSNWPVIRTIREHAGSGKQTNPDEMNIDNLGALSEEVVVEIKASFLRVSMKLVPKTGYSDSVTVALKPVIEGDRGHPCLYYVYRATVRANVPTDSGVHYGAGSMDVLRGKGPLTLRGIYWTEREWRKGMNTAGILDVKKVTSSSP